MRKILIYFLFFSSCIAFGNQNCADIQPTNKQYVPADRVIVHDGGILIVLEDIDLITNHLFCDSEGLYYSEEGVMWRCRNCGALNDLDNSSCYRCHEPR